MKAKLILMRHGKSEWNEKNLFTGWVDVPLNESGVQEALEGGKKMRDLPIDIIFTSTLVRAHTTLTLSMLHHSSKKVPVFMHTDGSKLQTWGQIYSEEAKKGILPVYSAWELNERMYGKLQGLNKAETAEKYGKEQVQKWRRSFDTPPPKGECLADTAARAIPYFMKEIMPHLEADENVFISAHGNSLRAIIMYLDHLTKEEVLALELATGIPIFYDFENGTFLKGS